MEGLPCEQGGNGTRDERRLSCVARPTESSGVGERGRRSEPKHAQNGSLHGARLTGDGLRFAGSWAGQQTDQSPSKHEQLPVV